MILTLTNSARRWGMLLSLMLVTGIACAQIKKGNLWYDINLSAKTAEVTYSSDGSDNYSDLTEDVVIIPKTITTTSATYTVISIGEGAFRFCSTLKSIEIPETVTKIADQAFYQCEELQSINFPDGLESIGEDAFTDCRALQSISIPASVEIIGTGAFRDCSGLQSVTLANGIEQIEDQAFWGCNNINFGSIVIPPSVTYLGKNIFNECTYLRKIAYPDNFASPRENVASPDNGAMMYKVSIPYPKNCYIDEKGVIYDAAKTKAYYTPGNLGLLNDDPYILPSSVTSIGDFAFFCTRIASVTIPESVTVIGKGAFQNCHLTALSLPESLKAIGDFAFYGIYHIESAEIPNSVNSLGKYAFGACSDLATVKLPDNLTSIPESLFVSCPALKSIDIPSSVSSIGDCAFASSGLSSILIPASVESIGAYAFSGCNELTSVVIPKSVTTLGHHIFTACNNLISAEISGPVTVIPSGAFNMCPSLRSVVIPASVSLIDAAVFTYCNNLETIFCYATEPPALPTNTDINSESYPFYFYKDNCKIVVPSGCAVKYEAADHWKEFPYITDDAVFANSIQVNKEKIRGKVGLTFQLQATITPVTAISKLVLWSSGNPAIATVDADGMVTLTGNGETTVTARTFDGSDVTASVSVKVCEAELGDADNSGSITVADAVNIANYAIGKEVDNFYPEAADVNDDNEITLADASATVTLVLEQPVTHGPQAKPALAAFSDRDMLIVKDFSANIGETANVAISLDNTTDYVALQADITLPEGMTIETINTGDRAAQHALAYRGIDNRTIRVALFNLGNQAFSSGDALIEMCVAINSDSPDDITLSRIIAADTHANEFTLGGIGAHNTAMSGIETNAHNKILISTADGTISICNAEGSHVAIYALDGRMIAGFTAASQRESRTVAPGAYIVVAGNKVSKVMIR